jgi:uncharacterized membrane protein
MSTLVVVIFDEEAPTTGFVRSLRALHDQGRISVHATATIVRGKAGVATGMPVDRGDALAGPAVAAAMGALVSLLEGPLQAAARAAPHSLIGAMRDLEDGGLDPVFLEQVSRDLPVGAAAVLGEVEELQPLVIDKLGSAHGGRVFRQRLAAAFVERRLAAQTSLLRQELARMQARKQAGQPDPVMTAVSRAKGIELASAVRRAKKLAASLRREAAAKRESMLQQAARLDNGPRQAVLRRAAVVHTALERRAELLERACGQSKVAEPQAPPIDPAAGANDS